MANRSDTFDRSDSTSALGTPSDGGSDWVAAAGTWGISSNRAYSVTEADNDLAYLEASASNVDAQVTVQTQNDSPGLVVRFSDTSNYLLFTWDEFAGDFKLYKNEAGSFTSIGSWAGTIANGDVFKLRCVGDQVSAYINGTLRIGPVTESHNQAATKHGLWTFATGGGAGTDYFDDFSITDLSGAGPRRTLLGVGR